MFIRSVTSRKSTCLQIGRKQSGKFILIKHVGCATVPAKIAALRLNAQQILAELRFKGQLPLFPLTSTAPKAKLSQWKITGFHHVFGRVYDTIGFPQTLLRDLVVGRIVCPKSKAATIRYLNRYLGFNLTKDTVYRFLDSLRKQELTQIAFRFVASKHPGGISVCFYDVTTLYFETAAEDDFKQKGFSKDHRSDMPQVVIGLFVDENGYPFDFDYFPGKTFEGHTFPLAINNIFRKYAFTNLTVVADAGMLSKDNLDYLADHHFNYVVGARLKNLSDEFMYRVINHDYHQEPLFQTILKDPTQQLIVDYSSQRAKQNARSREKALEKLKHKLATGKTVVRKSKYLKTAGKNQVLGLDKAQIAADQQFDGLKGYVTNADNPAPLQNAIDRYHQLWQAEKAFRMSKNDLKERPVYHQQPARVKAHLLLCFVSLLVVKETEKRLAEIGCSLKRAIELLGRAGQGRVRIGTVILDTESELDAETQLIHNLFDGH